LPESFAPSAELILFPECYATIGPFYLRVSGAVAPSVLNLIVSPDRKYVSSSRKESINNNYNLN